MSTPSLPKSRGPISDLVLSYLKLPPCWVPSLDLPLAVDNPLTDEDLQIALYACYELHYRGFSEVDPQWEWEPSLLAVRKQLEEVFQTALFDLTGHPCSNSVAPERMDLALREIADTADGPSLSRYIEFQASQEQVKEFLIHRSAYQLKEADPHSWAIPRLDGPPKAALIEVQTDEYGGGSAELIHAQLFADSMEALGLNPLYGAYLNSIPGITLATVNLMSLLGLHRRWRGAIVGHLALFEMTSSIPNRRYASGLRRVGFDQPPATRFFDEHVVADAAHENIAAVDLAGGLVRQNPELAQDVLWGARALMLLEEHWSNRLLTAWNSGVSSLLAVDASPLAH